MDLPWERLSDDTKETCDVGEWGWSRSDPDRCSKKAEWINRSTCDCGACDMTIRECDEHYQKRTKEAAEASKRFDAKFRIKETKLADGIVMYERKKRR